MMHCVLKLEYSDLWVERKKNNHSVIIHETKHSTVSVLFVKTEIFPASKFLILSNSS